MWASEFGNILTLSGPSAAILTSRPAMPSVVGCFGWLGRRAMLAYELYWTCDCLEAPRPSAADSRRLCPFSCVGILAAPLTSACVLLPVLREVAFDMGCLRCAHPLGVALRLNSALRHHLVAPAKSVVATKVMSLVHLVSDGAHDIG